MLLNWIKEIFFVSSLRKRGQDFAHHYLQNNGSYEELAALADNPFDFSDFDRGILDVLYASTPQRRK